MDVTPQELRSSEIKDSWRGYDRDEVDDLLERAAVTIESLSQELHEAQSRPVAAAPVTPAPPAEVPLPSSRDDADMLQRTLLLAQRAADDAVNEAQARAKQMLEESEAKAQALVSDAEATARRIAEGERRRLEAELVDLSTRREKLRQDADALEAYVSGYRDRIRAAIEDDLARLGGDVEAPLERPELHEVVVPAERDLAPTAAAAVVEPTPVPAVDLGDRSSPPVSGAPSGDEDSWDSGPATHAVSGLDAGPATGPIAVDGSIAAADGSSVQSPVVAPPRPESAGPAEWPPPAPSGSAAPSAPAGDASDPAAPAGSVVQPVPASAESSWLSAPDADWDSSEAWDTPAPWEREDTQLPLRPPASGPGAAMDANTVDTDSLDDDAFFASLREAVRDDAPLGPRDDEHAPYLDDADQDRRRFRRRR